MRLRTLAIGLGILVTLLAAQGVPAQEGSEEAPLRIGFNGGDNPGIIKLKANAFIAYLAEHSGLECEAFISGSYSELIRAIAEGRVEFAFLSPLGFITAEKVAQAEVLLQSVRSGQPFYWSVILVRKDSGFKALTDLKGKRFAFTHLGSTSGYVIPMASLLTEGIEPDKYFADVVYAGGHGAVIRKILDGEVDAGATFADDPAGKVGSWTAEEFVKAEESRKLKPIFFSDPIPGDTFTVTRRLLDDAPRAVKKVKGTLITMGESRLGQTILRDLYNIDSLKEASSADYDPVRQAFERVHRH